jgi:hypothetical protein
MTTKILSSVVVAGLFWSGVAAAEWKKFGEGNTDGKMEGKTIERPAMFDPKIKGLYQQALVLYRNRRYDEAEANCRQILTIRTNEANTVQLLQEIQTMRETVPAHDPGAALKRKCSGIILPAVNFTEAEARSAVEQLQQLSGQVTADRIPVNLVFHVPDAEKIPTVTMTLYKVPLTDVLMLVTEATGLRCRWDENAVVITRLNSPAEEPVGRPSATELRRKLETTVLPELRFADVPVRDALAFTQQACGKAAVDQTPFNVVWGMSADKVLPKVTLRLYRVTTADALRYLTELAGLRYRVDERAVVIGPVEPPKSVLVQDVNQRP